MSIMGNIAGQVAGGGGGGIVHFGWDRDLVEVPTMRWWNLSGATEEQANAALYVDAGTLFYDSDLAVAAGAAGNWTGYFLPASIPEVVLASGAVIRAELEVVSVNETDGGFGWLQVGTQTRNADGTALTVPGGTNGGNAFQARSASQDYAYPWGQQDWQNSTPANKVVTIQPSLVNMGGQPVRCYYTSDNTHTTFNSRFAIANARDDVDGLLPADAITEPHLSIRHYQDYIPRIAGRIHKLDFIYSKVAE